METTQICADGWTGWGPWDHNEIHFSYKHFKDFSREDLSRIDYSLLELIWVE